MKGLLMKDYRLLLSQNNLLIVIPIGLLLLFTNETPIMGISYTMFVVTFLSISILSYDEFDNGMVFLMTLPSSRKTYVTEKYIFSFLNSSVTGILLTIIAAGLLLYRGSGARDIQELLLTAVLLFAFALVFFSIMLPLQLKFGPEKSKVTMMIFFGILFLGTMLIGTVAKYFEIDVNSFFDKLNEISLAGTTIGILIVMVLAIGISWGISQKVMNQRDF